MSTSEARDFVVEALTRPAPHFAGWTAREWSALFQQARQVGLLGRIGERLRGQIAASGRPPWPAALQSHLASEARVTQAQRGEVDRELGHIARALTELGAPVVVLKGAAYHAANLPPAASRVFSDVDILVPRESIVRAESLLMLHGWAGTHANAYDQRYYREWMHELPPMQHLRRGTTLDLHHNILPLTARLKPDGAQLIAASTPLPGWPGLYLPSPPDMALHCMTHLTMNEEMSHALRDLSDLDLLLRHFGTDAAFWPHLLERAALLDLRRPLYYGLRHAERVFATPIPPHVKSKADAWAPPAALRTLMHALWRRALHSPSSSEAAPSGRAAALFALYLRGHWLRMPPWLLARHLTVKALRLNETRSPDSVTAATQG